MRVLIALDESPASARAAREVVRLLSSAPSVQFLVVNVSSIPVPWVGNAGFGAVGPLMVDPAWLAADPVSDVQDEGQLLHDAEAAGVPDPSVVVRTGDPVQQICAVAEENGVDLIVVGSHDKSGLQRLFDPSVAAGVVRCTYKPVLVVSGTPPTTSDEPTR